jgi:hypothetical protein
MSFYSTLLPLIILIAFASFASGWLRGRFRFAPIIGAGLIVAVYLTLATIASILAARCWECSADNQSWDNRGVLKFDLLSTGVIAIIDLFLIWTGTRVSRRVWKKRA